MSDPGIITGATAAFASDVYDIEAVKRAAYRFSDRVSIEIVKESAEIRCTIKPLQSNEKLALEHVVQEFRNEVLDQDLRLKIAAETEGYRNLVLSLAFSKTPISQ